MDKNYNERIIFNDGYFGFCNDEECSEMWYVMWIVEFSELLNFWMYIVFLGIFGSMFVLVFVIFFIYFFLFFVILWW